MELLEFTSQVPAFERLPPRDQICLLAWHLHVHRGVETIDNAALRDCFRQLSLVGPDVSVYLPRMASRKPPDLVKFKGAYRLEGSVRRTLDTKYGTHHSVVVVSQLLSGLVERVADIEERTFLDEAIRCYRAKAYRAAIVMTWNMAFDHLLRWILSNPTRKLDFSRAILKRYPKKIGIAVERIEDFEELKEAEVVDICGTANLL